MNRQRELVFTRGKSMIPPFLLQYLVKQFQTAPSVLVCIVLADRNLVLSTQNKVKLPKMVFFSEVGLFVIPVKSSADPHPPLSTARHYQ